ncbi:MAG: hypothetical protein SFX73_07200 [Kofleriaceae bacterium]|nr:hypothetical protein [Kofleriaceae bacterium]
MKHAHRLAALATVTLTAAVAPADALPDKNADREGWIKASMEGRQAAFCSPIAPKQLTGPADPDFMTNQIKKDWDGAAMVEAKLDSALALANAICKFPGNPSLQAALMPHWQAFASFYGLGAADLADVAASLDTRRTRIELVTRGPKDTRLADADPITQTLIAKDHLIVTSYGMDFMSYAQLLDATPSASEALKAAFVEQCVDSYHGSIARWAICKVDALGLDRKRYDKELAGAKIDPRHRLEAKLRFVKLQHAVKARAETYAAEAGKDDGVARVIGELPASAVKTWSEESAPYKSLLAWTSKIVDDANANSKKLMNGCEQELSTHLASYLGAKKPATPDDLKDAFRDNIGSQLGNAAALCFVRNEAARKFWAEMSSGFAERWGVRTLTWHALVSTKIEFDTNRGQDPLGLPKPVITYANASTSTSSGTIATLAENGDRVDLTFKKETWKETVCKNWVETNRIDGFDFKTNKFVYRMKCTKTGTETRSSTATPVSVDKAYAAGLKVGVAATFVRNSDGSSYPIAVFTNAKRNQLAGAFGVIF